LVVSEENQRLNGMVVTQTAEVTAVRAENSNLMVNVNNLSNTNQIQGDQINNLNMTVGDMSVQLNAANARIVELEAALGNANHQVTNLDARCI